MIMALFSHKFVFSFEPLLKLETEIPKRLHPIEQELGYVELTFVQGYGCLSEHHDLHNETEYP